VRGAGVSGDTTAGGLARVDFSVQRDTDVTVVALGANDLLRGQAGVARVPALNQRDGIHPNAAGVRVIARTLAPTVANALRAR
jgi:lysophospholipase L1-like esterase